MSDQQVDILIIGGGLTGAILMLALADKGYSCLLVDAKPLEHKLDPDFDARSLALSPASIRILEMLNLWPLLQNDACAIANIHVSEKGSFGTAKISSKAEMPLGYVVEMHAINCALAQLIPKKNLLAPGLLLSLDKSKGLAKIAIEKEEIQVQAKLIVGADGTDSTLRSLASLAVNTKDYQQQALVANLGLARSHQHLAFERFTSTGPLALLPLNEKRVSLVWALPPAEAERLTMLEEADFLAVLNQNFGYRLGRFMRVGKRVKYPLRQYTMPKKIAWPLVFVGNAAQTLHPVAGQGFNLGLRDVATLAQSIIEKGLNEAMLTHYQQRRQHDDWVISQLTDNLIRIFRSRLPGMALARSLGLIAVDNLAILKQCLTHYTRGFGGITPDLVCGIPLQSGRINEPAI